MEGHVIAHHPLLTATAPVVTQGPTVRTEVRMCLCMDVVPGPELNYQILFLVIFSLYSSLSEWRNM